MIGDQGMVQKRLILGNTFFVRTYIFRYVTPTKCNPVLNQAQKRHGSKTPYLGLHSNTALILKRLKYKANLLLNLVIVEVCQQARRLGFCRLGFVTS